MSAMIAIAVGGAAGALARYGIDSTLTKRIGPVPGEFPWATLLINVAGSFLLGVLFVTLVEPANGPSWLRDTLTVGFLSSFTTFSTFSAQTVLLMEAGRPALAITYVLASLVLCVLGAAMAILVSRISPVSGWAMGSVVVILVLLSVTQDSTT